MEIPGGKHLSDSNNPVRLWTQVVVHMLTQLSSFVFPKWVPCLHYVAQLPVKSVMICA